MRELRYRLTRWGCENASTRDGGQRQQSSQMPFCNGTDTAKAARVSHTKWLSTNEAGKADDGGPARWCAPRSVTTSFAQSESCGPTGKRSAGKLACSVWSGGKAARPYLSLLRADSGALAAAECQPVVP